MWAWCKNDISTDTCGQDNASGVAQCLLTGRNLSKFPINNELNQLSRLKIWFWVEIITKSRSSFHQFLRDIPRNHIFKSFREFRAARWSSKFSRFSQKNQAFIISWQMSRNSQKSQVHEFSKAFSRTSRYKILQSHVISISSNSNFRHFPRNLENFSQNLSFTSFLRSLREPQQGYIGNISKVFTIS